MVLDYRKNELEEQMLMNLHQKSWTDGLKTVKYEEQSATNEKTVKVRTPIYFRPTQLPQCLSLN